MSNETKQKQTDKKDLNIIKLKKGETVNISKALGSSKRLSILQHLSQEELNLSEIAEKIDSTPQAVYHHLQILEKSKLVQVVREEQIKNMATLLLISFFIINLSIMTLMLCLTFLSIEISSSSVY